VLSTASNSGAQRVKVKVPSEALKVKAYVGKTGSATGSSSTYNALSPVKTAVAKLASEVGATPSKNAVLVGGPCANSLVQSLVDAGSIPAEFSCAGGVVGTGWTSGTAYIWATEFSNGKVAIVAAGTNAADTRLATSVLQNYDHSNVAGKLTGTGVKITGTDVSSATIAAA
jgi:S-layer protein (TIGR01564 family)